MIGSVQTRSTTWDIQYGIGTSPTTWMTFAGGIWSDPAAFGSTTLAFSNATDMAAISNQSDVWFRVVALTGSLGTGTRDTMAIDNFTLTPVPEPGTVLGVGAAALALGGFVRRKWRKPAAGEVVA